MRTASPIRSTVGRSVRSSPVAANARRRKSTRPATSSTTIRGVRLCQPSGRLMPPCIILAMPRNWLLAVVVAAAACHRSSSTTPPPPAADAAPAPARFVVDEVGPFVAAAHGMAFDRDGVLYLSDSYAKHGPAPRVYAMSPPAGELVELAIEATLPAGLLWEDGSLYVCDVGGGRV